MAKKIPVPAVLSFWSIKGIAIPLLSHAKNFLFLIQQMHIFKREETFLTFINPLKSPLIAKELLVKENYPTATKESK